MAYKVYIEYRHAVRATSDVNHSGALHTRDRPVSTASLGPNAPRPPARGEPRASADGPRSCGGVLCT